jgi:hypothetical protein
MGGYKLVTRSDDEYKQGDDVASHVLAPGRFDGEAESALYPGKKPDEAATIAAEDKARVSSLLHAAAYGARSGWRALSGAGSKPSKEAIAVARNGCVAATENLTRALGDLYRFPSAREAFGDAYANVQLLLDASASLSTPLKEAEELRQLLAAITPPKGFERPTTISEAKVIADASVGDEHDRSKTVDRELRHATRIITELIDSYRDACIDKDANQEEKVRDLGIAAGFGVDAARYATRMLDDPAFALDPSNGETISAIVDFNSAAQRLTYWAMAYEPAEAKLNDLADALEPLTIRVGLSRLDVAPPRTQEMKDAIGPAATGLNKAWSAVCEAQRTALSALATREEPKESAPWYESLAKELCGAAFAMGFSVLGAELGVIVGAKLLVSELMKRAEKATTAAILASPASSKNGARHAFFETMQYAVIDSETEFAKHLVRVVETDALRDPNGGETISALTAGFEGIAVSFGKTMKTRAVQAWASYLAMASNGRDAESGGTDMTGVGHGIGAPIADGDMEASYKLRPRGILELHVSLVGRTASVKEAIVQGLRKDDRADLTGARIGDLEMPVQIYVHGDYSRLSLSSDIEATTPTYAVVSRNEKGAFWLRDSTRVGRIQLAILSGGDGKNDEDALRGAVALWDLIANKKLAEVGS